MHPAEVTREFAALNIVSVPFHSSASLCIMLMNLVCCYIFSGTGCLLQSEKGQTREQTHIATQRASFLACRAK